MCLLQLRLVAQIQDVWNKLQSMHGELTHHLSEATVNPETMDKNLELAIDVQLMHLFVKSIHGSVPLQSYEFNNIYEEPARRYPIYILQDHQARCCHERDASKGQAA